MYGWFDFCHRHIISIEFGLVRRCTLQVISADAGENWMGRKLKKKLYVGVFLDRNNNEANLH